MAEQQKATNPNIQMSGVRYDEPVGKGYELSEDAEALEKQALNGPRAGSGEVINLEFRTAEEAFKYRLDADAHSMFFAGTWPPDMEQVTVVPKDALSEAFGFLEPDQVDALTTATKGNLAFREGGGLMSIDIDFKRSDEVAKLWPDEFEPFETPEAVCNAIYEVLPEARDCPILVMPSSSSMIEREADGRLLKGPGGWRVLIPVTDARKIPEILEIIHMRCWAQ